MDERNELITRILDLLDTACQASLELLRCYGAGEINDARQLLQDLRAVNQSVSGTELASQLERSGAVEMLENVDATLDEIEASIQAEDAERAAMKIEFQLFPFLRLLKECFYFWGMIYPDQDKMERYYQQEFAEHFKNLYAGEDQALPFRLSIVIPAYNHLETTKQCIKCLMRETDFNKLNAELILIDHGSTDGTLEYFESLGIKKVIHFKRNARMQMLTLLFQVCQGRYIAFINNDILVTRNWAEILLNCLESDPNIIAAAASTPNISNLQSCGVPSYGPEEFVAWASQHNKSDPSKWSDRTRLMPSLGMYQLAAVNKIGFADPYFYSMEYWDDDFSLRARRAGFRQVLCGDVACYHFGSKTGREAQVKENTLVYGRELFLKKNGVDAWGSGFCYDYNAIQIIKNMISGQNSPKILCLDCGMGDTPMQIQNELRRLQQTSELYQITSQRAYLPDLKPHSKEAVFVPELVEGCNEEFGTAQFHLAYLGRDIGRYENCVALLETVRRRLAPGGWFVFCCDNPFYSLTIHAMLQFTLPKGDIQFATADPEKIKTAAEKVFSQVQMIPAENPVQGVQNFAEQHYGKSNQLSQIVQRLNVNCFYFACQA